MGYFCTIRDTILMEKLFCILVELGFSEEGFRSGILGENSFPKYSPK